MQVVSTCMLINKSGCCVCLGVGVGVCMWVWVCTYVSVLVRNDTKVCAKAVKLSVI